jgi:hypothetical protein
MDTFQTIGAILAVILTTLEIIERFAHIRRAFTWVSGWIKAVWHMFKDCLIWRKYHPTCEIVAGCATVTGCHIELPIRIKYTSKDKEYDAYFQCENITVDMSSADERVKEPYRLHATNEQRDRTLTANKPLELEFTLTRDSDVPPKLYPKAQCKIANIGIVRLHGMSKAKKLDIEQFVVQVRFNKLEVRNVTP